MPAQVNEAKPWTRARYGSSEIEDVADETEAMLTVYFERRFRQDDAISFDDLQVSQAGSDGGVESESTSLSSAWSSVGSLESIHWEFGRIADDVDRRHGASLDDMSDRLASGSRFARFALHLTRGGMSWGKLMTLVLLGYRQVRAKAQEAAGAARRGVALAANWAKAIIENVVQSLTRFIIENAWRWLVESGGWKAIAAIGVLCIAGGAVVACL